LLFENKEGKMEANNNLAEENMRQSRLRRIYELLILRNPQTGRQQVETKLLELGLTRRRDAAAIRRYLLSKNLL